MTNWEEYLPKKMSVLYKSMKHLHINKKFYNQLEKLIKFWALSFCPYKSHKLAYKHIKIHLALQIFKKLKVFRVDILFFFTYYLKSIITNIVQCVEKETFSYTNQWDCEFTNTYLAKHIHMQPHSSSISLHVYAKMYVQSIYYSIACNRKYISKGKVMLL